MALSRHRSRCKLFTQIVAIWSRGENARPEAGACRELEASSSAAMKTAGVLLPDLEQRMAKEDGDDNGGQVVAVRLD